MPVVMAGAPLHFWYEFASTYSYVAALRIDQLASHSGVEVEWRPFLLGPIFAEQGWNDSPFNIYPAKGQYMWRDMERICQREGLAFQKPSQFPRSSLLASRVALLAVPEGWCPEFSRAVYRANFAEDRDISQWETVAEIVKAVGRDPDDVYKRALSPENKDAVKAQTEEAKKLGIFGAPSFVSRGELFWGNDRASDAIAWHVANAGAKAKKASGAD